jgi:pheromone shutdown protein TraB
MLGPLLHERNWHLSRVISQAAAAGKMEKLAVVVGRGHVPGIVYCLLHPHHLQQQLSDAKHEGERDAEAAAQVEGRRQQTRTLLQVKPA